MRARRSEYRGTAPTYVPANGLTLGAASAVADPTSRTATAPSAASAMIPQAVHRVIDRVIVHLRRVAGSPLARGGRDVRSLDEQWPRDLACERSPPARTR